MNEKAESKKVEEGKDILERDKKFVNKIADELEDKAKALRRHAEDGDYYGIWLASLALSTLIEHLEDFVEEKRKQEWGRGG